MRNSHPNLLYKKFEMEECFSSFVWSFKKFFFTFLCQPTAAGAGSADTQCTGDYILVEGKTRNHRDKTRVSMPAKMFPHLKLLCWLFMGPSLDFDTKQRNSFFKSNLVLFAIKKQDFDNVIHS